MHEKDDARGRRLVVHEALVMRLGVPLVVVLLDEPAPAQLAAVRVLGADRQQAAEEAVLRGRCLLEASVVGRQVLLQVVLAREGPPAHLALERALACVQPHVAVQLGPVVARVGAEVARELAQLPAFRGVVVVMVVVVGEAAATGVAVHAAARRHAGQHQPLGNPHRHCIFFFILLVFLFFLTKICNEVALC